MAIQDVVTKGVGSLPGTVKYIVTHGFGGVTSEVLTYRVLIDWDDDGNFTGAFDDITADVWDMEWERGRDYASQLTGRSVAGRAILTVQNDDGKYSPFNTASPLSGNLLPKRKIQIRSVWPVGGAQWTGFIDRIEPAASAGQVPSVRIIATGALGEIQGKRVNPPGSSGATTDVHVTAVLDDVGWPAADRDIDTGLTTTGRWAPQDKDALRAIQELEETELGWFFETKDGKFRYEARGARLTGDQLTALAVYSDADGATLPYTTIRELDPLREIFNDIRVTVQTFTVQSLAVLWTLNVSSNPTLAAGASVTYWADYPPPSVPAGRYVDAWTTPVVGTDVTQAGVADGDIAIAVSKFGTTMKVTITNNHGADTATLTLVQARGTAVTADEPTTVSSEDSSSQSTYGERTYRLPGKFYANPSDAQSLADFVKDRHKDPSATLEARFAIGRSLASKRDGLRRDLSERVELTADNNAKLGIDAREFFIESIRHIVRRDRSHVVVFKLSQAELDAGFWTLGVSLLGVDTKLFA